MCRLLVAGFLGLLCPFSAMAIPYIEMTGKVLAVGETVINEKSYITLSLPLLADQPDGIEFLVDSMTEVEGIELTDDSLVQDGTTVTVKGVYVDNHILALEVKSGTGFSDALKGIVNTVTGRLISMIGVDIPVPVSAEIKDIDGKVVDLSSVSGRTVEVEGYMATSGDGNEYLEVSAVKEIDAFECNGQSMLVVVTENNIKTGERYCDQKGKRHGVTQISFADYNGDGVSSYTMGKYKNDQPSGYWLTIDTTGHLLLQCRYGKRGLMEGDPECLEQIIEN